MDCPGCTLFHSYEYTLNMFRWLPTRSDRIFPIIVILIGTHNNLLYLPQLYRRILNRFKCLYLSPRIESHFFKLVLQSTSPVCFVLLTFEWCSVPQAGSQEGNSKKTTAHHRRHYLPPLRLSTVSRLLVLSITLPEINSEE
jgi:hypothetical protein